MCGCGGYFSCQVFVYVYVCACDCGVVCAMSVHMLCGDMGVHGYVCACVYVLYQMGVRETSVSLFAVLLMSELVFVCAIINIRPVHNHRSVVFCVM